jgi:hypothetical protein
MTRLKLLPADIGEKKDPADQAKAKKTDIF